MNLYNIKDTISKIYMSEISLRRLIKKRKIGFRIIAGKYFFTDEDISAYLESVYHPVKKEIEDDRS